MTRKKDYAMAACLMSLLKIRVNIRSLHSLLHLPHMSKLFI